jgi:hypothetical protein
MCLGSLGYGKYNQFGFTLTTNGGVKRLNIVIKTSANHLQAPRGVVSGLDPTSPSLSRSSSIFKRLGFYTLAINCLKPVRITYLTMSTYTFNYCYLTGDNVDGGLRKKTLLIRSTHLHNILAPKIRKIFTNVPQAGALVPVETDKSEHSSLTDSLVFDKTCTVSLDTILFIERMHKIEDNRSTLYRAAFSADSLLVAYSQIKSKLENFTPGQGKEALQDVSLK